MPIATFKVTADFAVSNEMLRAYQRDGVLVLENMISHHECQSLMQQMNSLVNDFDINEHRSVFSAVTNEQKDDRYFLESGDKIRYFFEKDAFDEAGNLTVPRDRCLNKVGHALHDLDPVFNQFSRQEKFQMLVKALGMVEPLLLQSMYIFKQPHIGGEVLCHQDSPFLWTEPQSCIGLWFALEDATVMNGCLWGIKGMHTDAAPRTRLVRTGEYTTELKVLNDKPWPEDHREPIEVKAGSLVVLHGQFPHLSGPNHSNKSRHAYALHLIDSACDYPAENWLQRPADFPLKGF
jgi:phytanoyl-CoA hydroxylase